jgi:hypothetical protein
LEKAEEFRRRLRLSGINASVISKGATGYEVTVPKDELEKLTPKEKEAIKQYLEHLTQTGDEEKKKAAEEVLRRFNFGAKAINIGGIRLKLAYDSGKIKAEKIRRPTANYGNKDRARKQAKRGTRRRIRKMEKPHKNKRERKTPNNKTTIARKTRPIRPQHRQNTKRKNLKTHNNKDSARGPRRWSSRPVGRGFTAYAPAYKSLRPHHPCFFYGVLT